MRWWGGPVPRGLDFWEGRLGPAEDWRDMSPPLGVPGPRDDWRRFDEFWGMDR